MLPPGFQQCGWGCRSFRLTGTSEHKGGGDLINQSNRVGGPTRGPLLEERGTPPLANPEQRGGCKR